MDQAHLVPGVREGDVLAGKYRIDAILGAGGMGVVVAAHHIHLDHRVAIKFLVPGALANAEAVARFAREARAAVKIQSEHVARVSDVGTLENGAPYMVMEYLDGMDLSVWLAQRGSLPISQAVDFLLQAAEAIAEAHSLGIVHRDLKPANLFVIRRPDGSSCVKVLDFGISKAAGLTGPGSGATKTAAIMGSPLYMSPEQMHSSKDADGRSDIWAIGIILYELVTTNVPFVADTMPELVLKIVSSPPALLRSKRPDAPPALERIIQKCLEKDRGARFQTVGELATALAPFGSTEARASAARIRALMRQAGLSDSAASAPPSSDPELAGRAEPAKVPTAAAWGTTAPGKRASRKATFVAAAGAVLLAGSFFAAKLVSHVAPVATTSAVGSAVAVAATAPRLPSSAPSPVDTASAAEAAGVPAIAPATAPDRQGPAAQPQKAIRGTGKKAHESLSEGPAAATPMVDSPAPIVSPHSPSPSMPEKPRSDEAAPSNPNCAQKFYFDGQGNKHFKPECFR
jgi:serine/threonine-protein kinase